jgi:hypothetical protein
MPDAGAQRRSLRRHRRLIIYKVFKASTGRKRPYALPSQFSNVTASDPCRTISLVGVRAIATNDIRYLSVRFAGSLPIPVSHEAGAIPRRPTCPQFPCLTDSAAFTACDASLGRRRKQTSSQNISCATTTSLTGHRNCRSTKWRHLCMLKNYPIGDRPRPTAGTIDHAQWVSDRGPAALIEDRHDAELLPIVSECALRRQ